MQSYLICWYLSRNIDIGEQPLPCEKCLFDLANGSLKWVNVGVDINHLTHSFRGKRTHKKDGSDILLVCKKCHEDYHNYINNYISQYESNEYIENISTLNEKYLEIAQEMISVYSRMWCKEKLWELVRILYEKQK